MALNLSLTGLLYALCCLILCGLLLLDSPTAALVVRSRSPLALALGPKYLIRGIGAANRGSATTCPAWICAQIARYSSVSIARRGVGESGPRWSHDPAGGVGGRAGQPSATTAAAFRCAAGLST